MKSQKIGVAVVVYKGSIYNIPSMFTGFVDWLKKIQKKIPKQYLDSARFDVDVEIGYEDERIISIVIAYSRLETDKEYQRRKAKEKASVTQQEEKEKKLYEKLKEKYG
jgi:hypothetical protein